MAYRDDSKKWYAVNTNPRCEQMAYDVLALESFEAMLPKVSRQSKAGAMEPLFPGYLFVRLDLGRGNWAKINYLPGVRKIVSFGYTPVPVPEGVIAVIGRRIAGGDCLNATLPFKAGDRVRFESGPFQGLEGKFTGAVAAKERVKVLLEAMRRPLTVEVGVSELTAVKTAAG